MSPRIHSGPSGGGMSSPMNPLTHWFSPMPLSICRGRGWWARRGEFRERWETGLPGRRRGGEGAVVPAAGTPGAPACPARY